MDTLAGANISTAVRRARPEDAPALADLVNRAYAVEEFFVEGDRTSAEEVERMIRKGTFLVLERGLDDAADDTHPGILVAAIYVDTRHNPRERGGYIGMLSVEPSLQGLGLGTRLVRIAEAMCEAMGASSVRLRVVNLREELARWYRGLGYREVGTSPFEGPAKQPCHYVEMHKRLAPAAAVEVAAHA